MKIKVLLILAALLVLSSCNSWKQVPSRLERLVDKIEERGDDFSENNWEKVRAEYYDIMDQYYENRDKYASEDSNRILKAAGRYHALMLKRGFKDAASYINGIISSAPAYLEGIGEALEETEDDTLDAIEEGVENVADKISEGVENILDKIENLF